MTDPQQYSHPQPRTDGNNLMQVEKAEYPSVTITRVEGSARLIAHPGDEITRLNADLLAARERIAALEAAARLVVADLSKERHYKPGCPCRYCTGLDAFHALLTPTPQEPGR